MIIGLLPTDREVAKAIAHVLKPMRMVVDGDLYFDVALFHGWVTGGINNVLFRKVN